MKFNCQLSRLVIWFWCKTIQKLFLPIRILHTEFDLQIKLFYLNKDKWEDFTLAMTGTHLTRKWLWQRDTNIFVLKKSFDLNQRVRQETCQEARIRVLAFFILSLKPFPLLKHKEIFFLMFYLTRCKQITLVCKSD